MLHQSFDRRPCCFPNAAPYLHATIKAQVQIPLGDASHLAEMQQAKASLQRLVDRIVDTGASSGSNPTSH